MGLAFNQLISFHNNNSMDKDKLQQLYPCGTYKNNGFSLSGLCS